MVASGGSLTPTTIISTSVQPERGRLSFWKEYNTTMTILYYSHTYMYSRDMTISSTFLLYQSEGFFAAYLSYQIEFVEIQP